MTSPLIIILFSIIAVYQTTYGANSEKLDSCTTPNNDAGVCVEIRNCSIFMDAIRSQKLESYDFIRDSRCGEPSENKIKVCCGLYNNYLNQQITTTRTLQRFVLPKDDLFPKTCGKYSSIQTRISGGSEAGLGEFPWIARLRHLRSDGLLSYGCAGFLISEKFILTAAHCVNSTSLNALGPIYQVQLGEHNTETDPDCSGKLCADPSQVLRTSKPIVHPDYSNNEQYHHDIAVIPLEESAKLSRYVTPICLPRTSSNNKNFWVTGWGKTERRNSSNVKLQVLLPRVDWFECSNIYKGRSIRILESQVCAGGEEGKDACTGDSGGPLMLLKGDSWYAEGIVSSGKACGEKGWPGIYTNLPNYVSWIELVMIRYLEEHQEEEQQIEKPLQEDVKVVKLNQEVSNGFIWNR